MLLPSTLALVSPGPQLLQEIILLWLVLSWLGLILSGLGLILMTSRFLTIHLNNMCLVVLSLGLSLGLLLLNTALITPTALKIVVLVLARIHISVFLLRIIALIPIPTSVFLPTTLIPLNPNSSDCVKKSGDLGPNNPNFKTN